MCQKDTSLPTYCTIYNYKFLNYLSFYELFDTHRYIYMIYIYIYLNCPLRMKGSLGGPSSFWARCAVEPGPHAGPTGSKCLDKEGSSPTFPLGSMYGIFTYICHRNQSIVGKYTSPMDPIGCQVTTSDLYFPCAGRSKSTAVRPCIATLCCSRECPCCR